MRMNMYEPVFKTGSYINYWGFPIKTRSMKNKFISYISIFLFALLASCEKEVKTSHSESKSVCFYLSTTRATDVEFEKGDAIGVFAAARDDESVPAPVSYTHLTLPTT